MSELPRIPRRGGSVEARRERAAETRERLVATARALFAEAGFHATGTPEIVARADVTRGALYHHFDDKEDLFAEVFRMVSEELVLSSNAAVAPLSGKLWDQIVAAFSTYLQLVASNEEYQRILLIDGPAVLGWSRWRELQARYVGGGIAEALQMLMDQGLLRHQPPQPLANLILAALNDAALAIANSNSPDETSREVSQAFLTLLGGLRAA